MLESVRSDVVGLLFRLEPPPDVASLAPVQHFVPESESGGGGAHRPAPPGPEVRDARREALQSTNAPPAEQKPAASGDTVGRNDPCPCGSGKKYKKCHGK
ncbi:MAG: SEC-C domain-containing protein [Planctomycetales bacterium]|nr:SEC-C domain-containing protein [Planctomycetales bacterium]